MDQWSSSHVAFLDLYIYTVLGSDRLHVKPYSKPSKEFVPLHCESGHPAKCHTWPVAECARFARNSSDRFAYQESHRSFVSKLTEMHLQGDIIARVVDRHNAWSPLPVVAARRSDSDRPQFRTIALVLEFHPVLMTANLAKTIADVLSHFLRELRWILLSLVKFKVARKVTNSFLQTRLRHI